MMIKIIPLTVSALFSVAHADLVESNVAQGKPTFGDTAFGAPTSRGNDGIDGVTNTTNWTHADFPTSATPYPGEVDPAPNPYWQVDLAGVFDLTRIQLVDRVGCCEPNRLNGSTITLFDETGAVVGTPILVDGLPATNPAETAVLDFDNAGAGWSGVAAARIDGLATNQYLQFSEFRAFSLQPVNVALGATVTASGPTWGGQGPANITDGNFLTQSHPQAEFGTLGFTYSIDLGQPFTLEELLIYNRGDGCCAERLSNYRVSLHDDDGAGLPGALVWTADLRTDGSNSGPGGVDRLTADMDADGVFTGRHILIENLSDSAYNPQIGEVQALSLDDPPERPTNLALGVLAGYFNAAGVGVGAWGGSPPSNATDGTKGTFTHPLDAASADYYLEIDLASVVTVGSVAVSGRVDACCENRLEDARLELLDEGLNVVYSHVMTGQVTTTRTFDLGSVGARYVRIHNANGTDYGPQVAEVEVFAPEGSNELVAHVDSVNPATGEVTLTFNSVGGASYGIFASSALEDGTWLEVVDSVASQGELTTVSVVDTFGAGQARRFYRVERE